MGVALVVCTTSLALGYRRAPVEGAPGRYQFWPQRTIHYRINRRSSPGSPSELTGAIKRSFFAWSSPSCTDLYPVHDGTTSSTETNLTLPSTGAIDRVNTLVFRDSWPPAGVSDPAISELMPAVTTVVYDSATGEILDADIDVNVQDYRWTLGDDKIELDLQSVLTHEIGHLLGLAHSDNPAATMYPQVKAGQIHKRVLAADDLLGLCAVYPFGAVTPAGAGEGTVPQPTGCSVTGNFSMGWIWLLLLLSLRLFMNFRRHAEYSA